VRDLYRVLGVGWDAPQEEIHRAYRHKAKILHPDTGGSAEAFSELVSAYDVLSDTKRRERYDCTGEIKPIPPNNLDVNATDVIALKLGAFIHAEQDVTCMDITPLIEEAIHEDIIQRGVHISNQRRAIERVTRLRGRVKSRANDADNRVARLLDWHERSAKYLIKKDEAAIHTMERALEILQDYSFADDEPVALADDLSVALHDVLECLKQAGQPQPGRC
jgi:curved DNA-binding protein CbpA